MLYIYLAMLETPAEKQEFAELYEANRQRMFGVAAGILHDDYLAEDAVNQAFLKLIRHFRKRDKLSRNQMRNYLVIIVRNTAIDMYNDRHKIAEVYFDEARDISDGYDDDSFATALEHDALLEAFGQLQRTYKEVLYLSYFLGLSTKEIAESLCLSTSAVKSLLMRARAKMRTMLEGGDAR